MYAVIILGSMLGPMALIASLILKDHRQRERTGAYLSHPKGGLNKDEKPIRPIPIEAYLSDMWPFGGNLR